MSNEKKPSLSLLPKSGLWEAASALTYGRDKHGRYAWKQGSHNLTELLDKVLRHVTQFADGEDYCSESNLLHLGSAAADLLIAIDVYHNQKHLDDRFETNKTLAGVPDKTVGVGSEKESYWTAVAKETAEIVKQMQVPITFGYPDNKYDGNPSIELGDNKLDDSYLDESNWIVPEPEYDIDSDNNTGEVIMMNLKAGMLLIHPDGRKIPILMDGTFRVEHGTRVEYY